MTLPYSKEDLTNLAKSEIAKWERKEKQVWTNCEWFSVTFHRWDKTVRLFMKKTFLKKGLEDHEKNYQLLKETFWNIIPNTVYIAWIDWNVFSFSEPVLIEFDVFDIKNESFLKEVLSKNPQFRKQLVFFIKKFNDLKRLTWKTLDIIWGENLVYADWGKLKYIDSYIPFHEFTGREEEIREKIWYLERNLQQTDISYDSKKQ